MRIMNNVSALNAWRNMTETDRMMGKNLERLSSGFRINRAADDAAGLAMSEKMRAQIKGLNQSVKNAQDGISMVQTAEGALTEAHSIMQRMRELAVQSANGTLTGADRNTIQTEVDELATEVTRITNTTAFNNKDLINGAMQATAAAGGGTGAVTFQIGPNSGQTMTFEVGAMDAFSLGITRNFREVKDNSNIINSITSASIAGLSATLSAQDLTVSLTWDGANNYYIASLTNSAGVEVASAINVDAGEIADLQDSGGNSIMTLVMDNALATGQSGLTAEVRVQQAYETQFTNGAKLRDAAAIAGLDVTTESNAASAIAKIDTAINIVSAQRANFGAMQNRLEHTINNLSVVSENMVASESRIRDVDMAMEMTQFTKHQILMQSVTSMLSQANQKNQSVLSLLR